MPAPVTTRAQVNGYRFLLRRLEHALIRGDSRMIHDPMRSQIRSLFVGVALALIVAGAACVLAFFKPAPNFGDSTIMYSKLDGALFVRIGDRLHPVLNLASARLITGKSDTPKQVDDKFLDTVSRGPLIGIIGAPNGIHGSDNLSVSSWTACDTLSSGPDVGTVGSSLVTTVLANDPVLDNTIRAAAPQQMLLASSGTSTFLIYDGVRATINPADPVLRRALHLDDAYIRPISPGLLNSFPLVDPIAPITIQGLGEPTRYLPANYRIGAIVRTLDSRGQQLYVALRAGLQPVSVATADIIRYSNVSPFSDAEAETMSAALTATAPIVHSLNVDHYPTASPDFAGTRTNEVLCMSWQHHDSAAPTRRILIGRRLPLAQGAQPTELATSDGAGPGLDEVYITPGTGEYVQTTTADQPSGHGVGLLYYVSDLGLRFRVKDSATAKSLGVVGAKRLGTDTTTAQDAPWSVLSLLPPGPELSQQAALITHDGMAADPGGRKVVLPKG